jgi:hypothetical protein
MEKLTCVTARQIGLVDYPFLSRNQQTRITTNNYRYLFPLGREQAPGFKINRKLNIGYNHSTGKEGNLIHFDICRFKGIVSTFLSCLSQSHYFSFQPPLSGTKPHQTAGEKKDPQSGEITVAATHQLINRSLIDFLNEGLIRHGHKLRKGKVGGSFLKIFYSSQLCFGMTKTLPFLHPLTADSGEGDFLMPAHSKIK